MVSALKQQFIGQWLFKLRSTIRPAKYELRDYQHTAVEQTYKLWREGKRRVFVCAPTGSGKGTMIGSITRDAMIRSQRVVIVVTMLSLIPQAIEDCEDFGLSGNISVLCGSCPTEWSNDRLPIQIVTLQSLQRDPRFAEYLSEADLVIFDEFHTSGFFEIAQDILTKWQCWVASFSATPYNRELGHNEKYGSISRADDIVFCPDYSELQRRGYLAPLRYSALSMTMSTGQKRDLNSDDGIRFVVETYLNSEGVALEGAAWSLWFCQVAPRSKGEAQSQRLQRIAREYGLKLYIVNGDTDSETRESLLEAFKQRTIHGLISVRALAVGLDLRPARHVNLLATIDSRNQYVQTIGRVSRPDSESGKTYGYVNDFAGNVETGEEDGLHPIIEELSRSIKSMRHEIMGPSCLIEGEAPVKQCPKCDLYIPVHFPRCPHCDHLFLSYTEMISLEKGTLVQVVDWQRMKLDLMYAREQYRRLKKAVYMRSIQQEGIPLSPFATRLKLERQGVWDNLKIYEPPIDWERGAIFEAPTCRDKAQSYIKFLKTHITAWGWNVNMVEEEFFREFNL